jgi:hypothetical protein
MQAQSDEDLPQKRKGNLSIALSYSYKYVST